MMTTLTVPEIINVGTPVELPSAAPVQVRSAALALVYAVEELAASITTDGRQAKANAADMVISSQRKLIEGEGWKITGILVLSDGSRGWKLTTR